MISGHALCDIFKLPILTESEIDMTGQPAATGFDAVIEREDQIITCEKRDFGINPLYGCVSTVIGEARDILGILGILMRKRQDEQVLVIDIFCRHSEKTIGHQPGNIPFELATSRTRILRITNAVIITVKSSYVKTPVWGQRSIYIEIKPCQTSLSCRSFDRTMQFVATGLIDEIDNRSGSAGSEDGRIRTPHDFNFPNVFIRSYEVVCIHEEHVHGRVNWHPFFLNIYSLNA